MADLRPMRNGSVDVSTDSVAGSSGTAFPLPTQVFGEDVLLPNARSQSFYVVATLRTVTLPSEPSDGDLVFFKAMEPFTLSTGNVGAIDGDDHAEWTVPQYGGYVFQWCQAILSWLVMASTGQALVQA